MLNNKLFLLTEVYLPMVSTPGFWTVDFEENKKQKTKHNTQNYDTEHVSFEMIRKNV